MAETKVVISYIAPADYRGFAVGVQPDGKIIAAGLSRVNGDGDYGLVRYNTDGSLDSSFGVGGKVTIDIGSPSDGANALAARHPVADGYLSLHQMRVLGPDYVAIR